MLAWRGLSSGTWKSRVGSLVLLCAVGHLECVCVCVYEVTRAGKKCWMDEGNISVSSG